jgi:hypothetical protein
MTNTPNTPSSQTLNNEATKDAATGCCGGPAAPGADACCVKDAVAKAAGDAGCGCGTRPASTTAKSRCC